MKDEEPEQLSLLSEPLSQQGSQSQKDGEREDELAARGGAGPLPKPPASLADVGVEAGRPLTRVGRGAREVERALLDRIDEHALRVEADAAALAKPLRVVVPSRSLRDHVAGILLAHRGRPVVGVSIQTVHAVALEILERSSRTARGSRVLEGVLVRRLAAAQRRFAQVLDDYDDGFGIVEPTVDDLLDAGLGPEHADAVDAALDDAEAQGAYVERAGAAVSIALQLEESLEEQGFVHRSQILGRAAAALRDDPAALPTASVLIHGFAEATGLVTELLLELAAAFPATLLLDEPLEAGSADATSRGAEFARRLRERFEGIGPLVVSADEGERAPERVDWIEAPGCEPEVREVAGQVRSLLDEGARPEGIAVVARNPATHALALRSHFGRLGIPFSGVGAVVRAGSSARRGAALAELLLRGESCAADRWVAALGSLESDSEGRGRRPIARGLRADLQLGLRALGASRVGDVAALAPPTEDLALPARHGLSTRGDDEGGDSNEAEDEVADGREDAVADGPFAGKRRLKAPKLRAAIRRAGLITRRVDRWPGAGPVSRHYQRLADLAVDDLGWSVEEWRATGVDGLVDELPGDLELSRDEFFRLASERLCKAASEVPIGGRGGGVAVLGAMEARARTFEHLFVVGLNRDTFPRAISEDPLLADPLRRRLAEVLPDLPIKATGHDEERYLFAQLYSASPHVVLSWQSASDDGKDRVPSTFLDRLRAAALRSGLSVAEVQAAPGLHAKERLTALRGPCTALERVVVHGIAEQHDDHAALFSLALQAQRSLGATGPEGDVACAELATSRLAVMRELGRGPGDATLGPYYGFLGPIVEKADLRGAKLYVTTLERLATCGWQAAIQKLLRVEASPDPLESLPEIDARIVGMAVHDALERIFATEPGSWPQLTEVAARSAAEPRGWPDAGGMLAAAEGAARAALSEGGPQLDGLVGVLARLTLSVLERARQLDALADGQLAVLDAEVEGELAVDGAGPRVCFKADRVERIDGRLVLTDFKTSKRSIRSVKSEEKRLQAFGEGIARGKLLQAVAYARALDGEDVVGRYLFVRPEIEDFAAQFAHRPGEVHTEAFVSAFEGAVRVLGRSWEAGVMPPRLTEPEHDRTPTACGYCDVKDACVQGDSGLRRRQRLWIDQVGSGASAGDETDELYRSYWELGRARFEVEAEAEDEPGATKPAKKGRRRQ